MYRRQVVIDYTVPDSVNQMGSLYCNAQVPFVMGTTGGDREELTCDVLESNTYAVIAPQMGKQVLPSLNIDSSRFEPISRLLSLLSFAR